MLKLLYSSVIRFPQILPETKDDTVLSIEAVPYAKHNIISKPGGKQTGFLTEHTLFFVRQGKKNFHFKDEVITAGTDEIILIKRGIYTISEQMSANGVFEALMLFIPEHLLPKRLPCESVTTGHTRDFTVVTKNNLIDHFEQGYVQLFGNRQLCEENLLALKLQELFLLMSATPQAAGVADLMNRWSNKDVHDIEFIVTEHIFQPLDIPDYASLCCRSVASFKRDFKKQFKTSPRKWINERRIQHAHRLLQTTTQCVAEVAFTCGFESTSHFIRLYKAHYKMTPGKHRAE